MSRAYLDWNATTPPREDVIDAMAQAARESWANPSSIHGDGRRARAVVEDARVEVAKLFGADARDVVFTSSGTEANNLAVRSPFFESSLDKTSTLVTSRLEHPSVANVALALEREGRAKVRFVAVDAQGRISLDDLARALDEEKNVRLVTLQAVNHETGVIQPLAEAIAIAKKKKTPVHVDAVQAVGKMQDASNGADTRSIAAHKIRGPKGIGALVMRAGYKLFPVLLGGAQERGLRPGTVDPSLAAGFGVAAKYAKNSHESYKSISVLRDALESSLTQLGLRVIGANAARAPHVACFVAPGWIGAELVAALDLEGVSVASGSACSAGTIEPSPVLAAIFGEGDAARGLRVSLGPETTRAEIDFACAAFARVFSRGR